MTLSQSYYESFDAIGLAELVRSGEVSGCDLLEAAIARAEVVNPALNAICHPMYEAARADPNLDRAQGALAGVPFLLKDIATHVAGWPMSSGSLVFKDYVSRYDSNIVKRYRDAGLVFFGRTTSPELGYAATSESKLFGATRNPWNPALTAGGSSGGAAAAVAAGIVPVAQGGDAGGSLRIPSSFCGVFTVKPTRGRTPSGPVHGSFLGFSTTHVISRSVRDNALLLDLTSGPDAGAPWFAPPPERPFIEAVGSDPGRLRIAVQRKAFDASEVAPECLRAVDEAARLCRDLGHEVIDVELAFDHAKLKDVYFRIWPTIVLRTLNAHAAATGRDWRREELETYVARLVDGVASLTAEQFVEALENMHAVGQEYLAQSDLYDVVLSPTTAHPAPPIGVLDPSNPDQAELDVALAASVTFTQIGNVTGQPAASVPLHWTADGIPVGVQFAARYGDEWGLLRLAAQLERAQPWFDRRPILP